MYSKRENSKEKSSQKRLKSSSLFSECQKVISQLQTQLQHALKINQQKDQMIKMLTQQKQYYMNEAKTVTDKKYNELKQQVNWNNSLINGLKKHNKQIAEKYQKIFDQNAQISSQLKFKQELLNAQSVQIEKIKIQKDKIQSEWNRTLLSVKQRIIQLYRTNQIKNLASKKPIVKNQRLTENKYGKQQNYPKKSNQSSQSLSLSSKVQDILNQLDQKIIAYEVQDLIRSQCFQNKDRTRVPIILKQQNMDQINIDQNGLNIASNELNSALNRLNMIPKRQRKLSQISQDIGQFSISNKQNLGAISNILE